MTTVKLDGQDVEITPIYPHNAHLVRVYLEQYDSTVNDWAAWDDATSVTVTICTDKAGASPITGMGPFTLAAVSAENYPGYYTYTLPASVTALLDTDTYRGTRVWQIVSAGANAEVKVATLLAVTLPRLAA